MPKVSEGISHLIPAEMQMNAVLVLGDIYRPSVLKGKSATLLGLKFDSHRPESERKSRCRTRENKRGALRGPSSFTIQRPQLCSFIHRGTAAAIQTAITLRGLPRPRCRLAATG